MKFTYSLLIIVLALIDLGLIGIVIGVLILKVWSGIIEDLWK